jgi:hypothetical protein
MLGIRQAPRTRGLGVGTAQGANATRVGTGCSEMSVEANGLGVCGNAPIPTLCTYIVART